MPETFSINMGNTNYEGLSKEDRESLFTSKIDIIFKELIGFSQSQARYLLETVEAKLDEQREGILDQLTVIS